MKKLSYLFAMFVAALSFAACNEGTDFDIDYTPIAPIGGQYDIIIFEGEDENATTEQFWASHDTNSADVTQLNDYGDIYAYLSNTTDYDSDKAWLRILQYHVNNDLKAPYEIGCRLQRKRLECALMIKACEAFDRELKEKEETL